VRHRKKVKKLNRTASHRRAVLANLATAILDKERIHTTDALAKESKKLVERLITKAKSGTLHARRQVLKIIHDKQIVAKLFDTIAPRYADRQGGYVRLIRVGNRHGDGAALSIVELVGSELITEESKKAKKKRKKKTEEPEEVKPLAPVSEEVRDEKGEEKVEKEAKVEKEENIETEEEEEKENTSPVEDSETGTGSTVPEKEGGKTEGRG
jgi:large subunit ribosomal protein L17